MQPLVCCFAIDFDSDFGRCIRLPSTTQQFMLFQLSFTAYTRTMEYKNPPKRSNQPLYFAHVHSATQCAHRTAPHRTEPNRIVPSFTRCNKLLSKFESILQFAFFFHQIQLKRVSTTVSLHPFTSSSFSFSSFWRLFILYNTPDLFIVAF